MTFNITQLDEQLNALRINPVNAKDQTFDPEKDYETHTDKETVKLVPCRDCQRPLVVTAFFAVAKAICNPCREQANETGVANIGQPAPGDTDPAKAVHLEECLVNPSFATVLCPVHPDNPEHAMELKWITHNANYGPMDLMGYQNGKPKYRQIAPGETVTHQCTKCLAVVTYSTTAVVNFGRQNEPREDLRFGKNAFAEITGIRSNVEA